MTTYRSAGLVDLQVNGYAGVDFNDATITADALDHALHAMLGAGVTTCLPTIITAPAAGLETRLRALDDAVAGSRLGPLMVPGYHVEGPFLNPKPGFAGCHPPAAMIAPDPALVERWDAGASVSGRAADAGARMSTHLGNGLPGMLPKLDNPLMAQLAEDRLAAGFIADGIHLPCPALRAMIRAKGPGRAILVTDAVAAAGAPPGCYGFAGMQIEGGADGSARLAGTRALAGSALTLDRAVRNVVAWGIADLPQAVAMASAAPTTLLDQALAAHGAALRDGAVQWHLSDRTNRPEPQICTVEFGDRVIKHRV